nr:helix-turn-helix transcriptional regulator [Atopobacter phocae]
MLLFCWKGAIILKNIKIKMARLEKEMTQQDLAERIGVTRQTIGLIEAGNYNPTIKLCLKICYELDKSLDELFWEDKENEE